MAGLSGAPRARFRIVAMALGAALALAPGVIAGSPAGAASAAVSCTNTNFIGPGSPPTTGSISSAGQVDCYQIFAKAGQVLRVRVVGTGGTLVPSTEVDGPNGAAICGPASTNDQNCKPSLKGLQTIAIQDASGTNTGSYSVVVQYVKLPVNCGTLSFGSPPNVGTLAAGDISCFTFKAPAGSHLITRAVGTSGSVMPTVEELNAKGGTVCGPDPALEQNCRILAGGNQTIFVEDSAGPNTGQFSLYAQLSRTVTCATVKLGKAQQEAITSAGQTDCYKFSGTSGDHMRITVAGTSGTLNTDTEVLFPTGTTLCQTSSTPEQNCRVTSTGSYTILVSDASGTQTGNYTIYVQKLNAPVNCVPVQYGKHADVHPATIAFPGAENCYSFQGTAGTGAHLTVKSTGGSWTPEFEIIQPNGVDPQSGWCDINATDERCLIGATGTYLFLVRDVAAKNTGTFDYTLTERTFS